MQEFQISIRSFQQVQDFVALASQQPFDIFVGNENQNINGKDLMGMFSLDYSRMLQVKADCPEEKFLPFRQEVNALLA